MRIYFYDAFIVKKIIKMVFLFSVNTYVYNPMMLFIINIYVFITMIQITLYMLSHLKKSEVGSFEREEHQTDFSIKSTKTGVQTKIKRKS